MSNIVDKIIKQSNVPSLPAVAQKLVMLRVSKNTNILEFLPVLESDPILSTRIIRVANSAYTELQHKAATLDEAVSTLGINYVRSIALGFELVATLNNLSDVDFNWYNHWQQNVFRSVFARQLAKRYCPERREEAFLIALLLDCGIPLSAKNYGAQYTRVWQECSCSPASKYQIEQKLFPFDHTATGAALIRHWQLPEILAKFIRDHHKNPASEASSMGLEQLGQIAYFTGSLPLGDFDTICEEDSNLWDFSRSVFGLAKADFLELLESTRQEYHNIANLFSSFLPSQTDVTRLLIQAKALLNRYYERECKRFDCQTEIRKLKEQEQKTIDSIPYAHQEVSMDEQTGLVGRELLMKYLEHACLKVKQGETSLSVLFIDLDDFKVINDRYGNSGGNQVLEEVADLLQSFIKDKGCIARYGDDQFVMILLDLEDRNTLQLTKYLTEQIRQLEIVIRSPAGREKVQITASIGMVFCEPHAPVSNAIRILEHADHQMYEVKNSRKDGFSYIVLNAIPHVDRQAVKMVNN